MKVLMLHGELLFPLYSVAEEYGQVYVVTHTCSVCGQPDWHHSSREWLAHMEAPSVEEIEQVAEALAKRNEKECTIQS